VELIFLLFWLVMPFYFLYLLVRLAHGLERVEKALNQSINKEERRRPHADGFGWSDISHTVYRFCFLSCRLWIIRVEAHRFRDS